MGFDTASLGATTRFSPFLSYYLAGAPKPPGGEPQRELNLEFLGSHPFSLYKRQVLVSPGQVLVDPQVLVADRQVLVGRPAYWGIDQKGGGSKGSLFAIFWPPEASKKTVPELIGPKPFFSAPRPLAFKAGTGFERNFSVKKGPPGDPPKNGSRADWAKAVFFGPPDFGHQSRYGF